MADELNKKKPDLGSGSSSESAPKQAPTPKPASNPKQSSFNAPKKIPEQPKQVAKPQPVAKPVTPKEPSLKQHSEPKSKVDPVRQKILNQGFGPTQQQRLDSHNKLLGRVSQKYPSGNAGTKANFMYDNYQEGDYDQPNNAFGIHTNGKGPRRSNWIEQNPDGSYKYSYREGTHDGKEVVRDNLDDDGVMGVFDEINNGIVGGGNPEPASQKSAPEPAWNYPTDAEKNGNFNYSEARKNGFKHPTTGKESSDLYFKNNYTGPGYSAFEGLQPMKDPNDFSQNFEESFYRFPSEKNDFKGRPMVGEHKFYEDDDDNVWNALREAEENASDTDTVRDIISRASKESGIDEDRLLNAFMFQHFYFGSDFAFSPESNYKKVTERQNEDYKKYLPKEQPPKGHQPSDRDADYERSWGPEPDSDEDSGLSNELESAGFEDIGMNGEGQITFKNSNGESFVLELQKDDKGNVNSYNIYNLYDSKGNLIRRNIMADDKEALNSALDAAASYNGENSEREQASASNEEQWDPSDNPGSAVVTKKLEDWVRDYLKNAGGLSDEFIEKTVNNLHKDSRKADFYKGKMKEEYERNKASQLYGMDLNQSTEQKLQDIEPWTRAWLNRGDTYDFEIEAPNNDNIMYIKRKDVATGKEEMFVYDKNRQTLHKYENGGYKQIDINNRDEQ